MRAAILFFLAVCVVATLGQRTAVDLWWNPNNGPGSISLPSTFIGQSGQLGLEIQAYMHENPTTKNSLIFFSKAKTDTSKDIEVYINANRQVSIRLGDDVVTSAVQLDIKDRWNYLAVNIINDGTASRAELFINGVDQTATLNGGARFSRALVSERLGRNFIGYSATPNPANPSGPPAAMHHFNGMVDSFAIWGTALSLSTVQAHAKLHGRDPAFDPTGLIARYDFTETVGREARGKTGLAAQEPHVATLDFPDAVFAGGEFTGWMVCTGWGDPHWTDFYGNKFDTIHQPGYFDILRCVDTDKRTAFQIMTWQATGCCWGQATVIRAVQMRMGDTIVQWATSQAMAAGINGPWVKKIVPNGANPASINWESFTPSDNAPITIGSGIVVTTSGSSFTMYGAPFGYLTINDVGNYANMAVYANENSCTAPEVNHAVCKGNQHQVGGWFYADTPTSVPITLPPPVAQPPPQTCEPVLMDIATANCKRCFPKWNVPGRDGQMEEYQMCLGDICLTGNPYCPPAECVVGEPCCTCASTGSCIINPVDNSTSCACDAGYAGKDCDQRQTLHPLTLTTGTSTQMYDNLPYYLNGHNLAVDGDIDAKVAPTAAALAKANAWKLKNSLLAYIGYLETPSSGASLIQNSQHLYIVADATNGAVSQTVTLTYSGTTAVPVVGDIAKIGKPATVTVNSVNSVTLNTDPSGMSGFVIRDMKPANGQTRWCVTLSTDANVQVGIGSGNIRGQLDILRVMGSTGHQICGEPITNPCASIMNCDQCAANAQCGWCRTTGTCRLGRPAGPIDGSLCPAWAFTFDSVTRRITETYGYPVSPVDTTIVLGSNSESLPIELKVDMAYRFYSAWDVQIMFPRGDSNNAELSGMQGKFAEIANFFTANYVNTALSFAAYGARTVAGTADANGDRNVYLPVFPLTIPHNVDGLQSLMNAVTLADTTGAQTTLAITRAASTEAPNWRNGARHLLIIFATHADSTPAHTAAARAALLSNDVFPVFIVKAGVKAAYQTLVNDLKFGLVLDYNGYASIGTSIDRAMADASSSISVTYGTQTGRINTALLDAHQASLTLTGLQQKMRARAVIPVHRGTGNDDYAVLRVPAFGKAVIEAVASDSPYTNGVPVTAVADAVLDPYTTASGSGVLLYLTGKPADVLKSNAKVQAFVTVLTENVATGGTLRQFNETALRLGVAPASLPQIVPSVAGAAVTDVQGRVIYIPADNAFGSDSTGLPFATITYFVKDECSPSPPGPLDVYIKYANNEQPTTKHAAVNTNENQAVLIDFVGVDTRRHVLKAVLTQVPKNTAGNPALAGSLYAYSAACWTAVQANFKDVASCGAALVDGSEIDATTASENGNVFTTTVQAIYVPAEYANSAGIPAVYKTTPEIAYKFVQKQGSLDVGVFSPLETSAQKFDVVVAPVNQAPYSAKQAFMTNWLSWPVGYADVDPAACGTIDQEAGAKCTYDQNLGVAYPNIPASEAMYVFGADVDSALLSVRITEVNCPAAAQLDVIPSGDRVVAGMVISQSAFTANSWQSVIRFKPTQDGSGDPYCSFKYVVVDDGALESAENQVVIAINFQPLPPRSQNYRVFAPLIEATPFEVSAYTVNDVINGVASPVYIKKMTINSCSGDLTSSLVIAGVPVTCTAGQVIDVASNAADVDFSAGKQHTFSGSWTPTLASVGGFAIEVTYEDSHASPLVSAPYTISFSYRQINQGPQLQFITGSQTADDFGVNILNRIAIRLQGGNGEASIGHNVTDRDIGEGEMTVRVRTIGGMGNDITTTFNFPTFLTWSPVGGENEFVTSGVISTVIQELSALSISVNTDKETTFNVSITVEDNGATGACSADQVTPCNKIATSLIVVKTTKTSSVTAIALAAGAGGAALAAAAAAAIAWRALREPPTESYNPWEMDDSTEGTVMNPLFEASTKSGNNAIYEPSK